VKSEGEPPEPGVIDILSPEDELSSPSPTTNQASTSIQVASIPQQVRAALHGVDLVNDYVQRLTSPGGAQELSNTIDHGVRTATGAIEALLRGVPGRLHDALGQKQQPGAVQRGADTKGIDDALNGLRDFVSNIATGLGGPSRSTLPDSPGMSVKEDINVESTTTASDAGPTEVFSENATEALKHVSSALFHTRPSAREEQDPPLAEADAKAKAKSSRGRQAPSPRISSEIRPAQHTQTEDGSSIQRKGIMKGPRYHEPGPIHLPHATSSRLDVGPPSDDFKNSDHLSQSRSTGSVDKPAASPPPAATRFPTLAQFEGQNFAAAPSFPALPSMEPLVPQRVAPQTMVSMLDMQTREQMDATNPLADTSQHQNSNTIFTAKQCLVNNGINPARLTHDQLYSFTLQSPEVQAKSIQIYAQNMAKNQHQQERPQDSQMERKLNEGQDRTCLLKTRQKATSSDIASPNLQGGSSPTMQLPIAPLPNKPKIYGLQEYQMQLALLEQQNKKRWLMAQEEQKIYLPQAQNKTQSLAKQQLEVEQRNEEHTALAPRGQGASYTSPQLPGRVPHTQALEGQCNYPAAAETFGQSEERDDQDPFNLPAPSSAARLAEPFDPLDIEPSAQPQLNQGIRRNATVAGTDSRHNARRRRPYSDAFDGFGRVAWESFEGATDHEDHDSRKLPGMKPTTRRREMAMKGRDRKLRRQEQLRRSATLHDSRLTSPFTLYDDEHQDDSTVDKINSCVNQLRNLGFGGGKDESGERLLVYAQAAEGDLVEAIDMIDEEQRAYRRL